MPRLLSLPRGTSGINRDELILFYGLELRLITWGLSVLLVSLIKMGVGIRSQRVWDRGLIFLP